MTADSAPLRLLIFLVGDLTCAVPVDLAREIVPFEPGTRIPGAVDAVEGLLNVRGVLLTVVDGSRLLGRPSQSAERSVLVLDLGAKLVGLAVDKVLDLATLTPAALQGREGLPGLDPRLVRAVGRRDDGLFVVLDTEALLAPVLSA
ncbi:MAG TPA: chemotaxis protein CheW [Gemmatimonadales bacterium]|jgi:purine-binding chemotaxis protein CheW|nr:chemotaxis protein CheW [Gemmatimonadales bacterium]